MRSSLFGVMSVALVACGVFGSDEPAAPTTPEEDAKKAGDNAQPPAPGEPLTGVFVSSSKGNDEGSGTMENPVKTLARALLLGRERSVRVLACAEDYPEKLALVDGVSAFGNIDCKQNEWIVGTARARIVSPASPAVTAKDLKLTTKLEGFEVIAPDLDGTPATDEAGSSIALEVRDSKGLFVVGSLLHGGKGAPGTDGAPGPSNEQTAASDGTRAYDQTSRTCPNPMIMDCVGRVLPGPPGGTSTCKIGPNGGPGGQGGDSRWWAFESESTAAYECRGRPFLATATTAAGGGAPPSCFGKGVSGQNGTPGANGPNGSNGVWSVRATGFVRGNGTAGGPGEPGGGGGGGGGTRYYWNEAGENSSPPAIHSYYATASGGGGGAGGCAGQPGTPATGGGASIGAFLVASSVTFERATIESSAGGRAGKGNFGADPTMGGLPGLGTFHGVSTTGDGGKGGRGGFPGASGHGAPGPSIAIAYTEQPKLVETKLAPGPAGAGQPELKQSVAPGELRTHPAVLGDSTAEYLIKP